MMAEDMPALMGKHSLDLFLAEQLQKSGRYGDKDVCIAARIGVRLPVRFEIELGDLYAERFTDRRKQIVDLRALLL